VKKVNQGTSKRGKRCTIVINEDPVTEKGIVENLNRYSLRSMDKVLTKIDLYCF